MISLDVYVVEFIQGNFLSVTLLLFLLKEIAKMTPTVYDDKIATMLASAVHLIKSPPQAKAVKERIKAKIGHNV